MKNHFFFICLFAYLLICLFNSPVFAATMSGPKTKLNLQFKSQTSSISGSAIEETKEGPQITIKKDLYTVRLGYNSADVRPIGLAVSPKILDFGNLNPTSAVTRLQTVSVQKGPAPSYSLFISEDHPPQDASLSGKFVPNTTGDKDKVTIANSGYWISPLTYGFGYRARSKNKPIAGFEKEDTYKQFPSLENGNPPQPLLQNVEEDEEATIILKININNTQADTTYQNNIYYTLIPPL